MPSGDWSYNHDKSEATLSCVKGFGISDNYKNLTEYEVISCVDGEWPDESPVCKEKICEDLYDFDGSWSEMTKHNEETILTCNENYTSSSGSGQTAKYKCIDGGWDTFKERPFCNYSSLPENPSCSEEDPIDSSGSEEDPNDSSESEEDPNDSSGSISCIENLTDPENGTYNYSFNKAKLICDYGYYIKGSFAANNSYTRTCDTSFGTWSGIDKICSPKKCDTLSSYYSINKGFWSPTELYHGQESFLKCLYGYRIAGTKDATQDKMKCENGFWPKIRPICVKMSSDAGGSYGSSSSSGGSGGSSGSSSSTSIKLWAKSAIELKELLDRKYGDMEFHEIKITINERTNIENKLNIILDKLKPFDISTKKILTKDGASMKQKVLQGASRILHTDKCYGLLKKNNFIETMNELGFDQITFAQSERETEKEARYCREPLARINSLYKYLK